VCVCVCGARLLRLVRAADQTRLIICDETGVFRRRSRLLRRPYTPARRHLAPHLTSPSKPHRTPPPSPPFPSGARARVPVYIIDTRTL